MTAALSMTARTAHAQIPVRDDTKIKRQLINLAAHMGEWYAEAKVMRDKMLRQADLKYKNLQMWTNLHRLVQEHAIGELAEAATDGATWLYDRSGLPDPRAMCATDSTETSRCDDIEREAQRFMKFYDSTYTPWQGKLFRVAANPRDTLAMILFSGSQRFEGDLEKLAVNHVYSTALFGRIADNLAAEGKKQNRRDSLNAQRVDSLQAEVKRGTISSGRADQHTLALSAELATGALEEAIRSVKLMITLSAETANIAGEFRGTKDNKTANARRAR
jgi:hypothetical protein